MHDRAFTFHTGALAIWQVFIADSASITGHAYHHGTQLWVKGSNQPRYLIGVTERGISSLVLNIYDDYNEVLYSLVQTFPKALHSE